MPVTNKEVMKITKCPHIHRKHYAKNMCSSCYRKNGRDTLAFNCQHEDRPAYSMGMCQPCYITDYHRRKNLETAQDDVKIQNQNNA